MKIIQLLPTMSFGDAVSNDTLAIRRMIREMGIETEIYAENIDNRLPKGSVKPMREMPELGDEDLLIYHGSTGDPLNMWVPRLGGRKVMRYHNITPPEFFRGYSEEAAVRSASGLREMQLTARAFPYGIADSDFNRQDMRKLGFKCPIDVCPIVIPLEDYDQEPDEKVLKQYQGDGVTNLLFVGRIAPNKKQENVIRAFWHYRKNWNPKSRLFLVGSSTGMESYLGRLKKYVKALGIEESVVFPGQISFRAILAYYRLADVFVCMSEHEGFCVPIIEAMYFGKPIVALKAAAVPGTMGGAGLLLDEADPAIAGTAIDRIMRDEELREALKTQREIQIRKFTYEVVSQRMKKLIMDFASADATKGLSDRPLETFGHDI